MSSEDLFLSQIVTISQRNKKRKTISEPLVGEIVKFTNVVETALRSGTVPKECVNFYISELENGLNQLWGANIRDFYLQGKITDLLHRLRKLDRKLSTPQIANLDETFDLNLLTNQNFASLPLDAEKENMPPVEDTNIDSRAGKKCVEMKKEEAPAKSSNITRSIALKERLGALPKPYKCNSNLKTIAKQNKVKTKKREDIPVEPINALSLLERGEMKQNSKLLQEDIDEEVKRINEKLTPENVHDPIVFNGILKSIATCIGNGKRVYNDKISAKRQKKAIQQAVVINPFEFNSLQSIQAAKAQMMAQRERRLSSENHLRKHFSIACSEISEHSIDFATALKQEYS